MNIKLACNYNEYLRELIDDEEIEIDYVKIPSICEEFLGYDWALENNIRIMFHGLGIEHSNIAVPNYFVKVDIENLKNIIKTSKMPHISAHISTYIDSYPEIDWNEYAECNEEGKKIIENNIIKNVEDIKKVFDLDVILENVPFYGNYERPKFLCYPEMVKKVLEKTNCNFLLDLSHSKCTAYNSGVEFLTFLQEMPLEKVIELHVSGSRMNNDILNDEHQELREDDYNTIEFLLRNCPNLKYLTLEYTPYKEVIERYDTVNKENNRKEKDIVKRQLTRLKEMINK
jgi:Uncharacterized protein conserved in bacteria